MLQRTKKMVALNVLKDLKGMKKIEKSFTRSILHIDSYLLILYQYNTLLYDP